MAASSSSTAPPPSWIIRAKSLKKRYASARSFAVDDLSLVVNQGTIFGILGPNGAGKTTTLSMLCGLLTPDAGSVEISPRLKGENLAARVGYVPQELALYPQLTGNENLSFFGRLYSLRGDRLKTKMAQLLALVGLTDRGDDPVATYSTGMKRRLNLAAGLIHEPTLILLDEPTVGIDPQSRNCIFEAVLELRQNGATLLYTTHYMEEVSVLCDRIAIMDHGKILLEGDPRGLVAKHGFSRVDFRLDPWSDPLLDQIAALSLIERVEAAASTRGFSVFIRKPIRLAEAIDAVTSLAARNGNALTIRRATESNLENLFLDITGRHLRDGAEPIYPVPRDAR